MRVSFLQYSKEAKTRLPFGRYAVDKGGSFRHLPLSVPGFDEECSQENDTHNEGHEQNGDIEEDWLGEFCNNGKTDMLSGARHKRRNFCVRPPAVMFGNNCT